MRRSFRFMLLFSATLLLWQCAQIMPLTGGARDLKPPVMLSAVPEQNAVQFNSDKIVLSFDEFVQLKNLNNQLIISPKLKTTPEITAEGKKIIIQLKKEELLPNTTYRFSFARAIADMNESNSIPGFDYVFSTGNFIDSLKINGSVNDAFTNKSVGGILVGLYPTGGSADSIVFKKDADYIARTDDEGAFTFKNLPYTTYRLYAFSDKNKNGTYDGESEKVAFYSGSLNMQKDTSVQLRLFQETSPRTYIKKVSHPYYGFTQLILNKKSISELHTINKADETKLTELKKAQFKDTLSFFYTDVQDSLKIIFKAEGFAKADTIKLKLPRLPVNNKKKLVPLSGNISSGNLPLTADIMFQFSSWMDTTKVNLRGIHLNSKDDSLITDRPLKGKWTAVNAFKLISGLKEGKSYLMKVDTGVFYDRQHQANDSAKFSFKTQSKADLGKLTIKLLVNKKQHYLLELVNDKEEKVLDRSFDLPLASSNSQVFEFEHLLPGTYHVRLIVDDNQNKKWDSGDVVKQLQPERIIIHPKQLKVISDWEVEEEVSFKE